MGNNPSTAAKSTTASPAGSTHGSAPGAAPRREPKLRDNIGSQRTAVPPEPSLAQARGTNVSHRARIPQSQQQNTHFEGHSPSPKDKVGPFPQKLSETGRPEVKDEPSKPVAVPITSTPIAVESNAEKSSYATSQIEPSGPPTDPMAYHLSRPPRLPLPIEEEVHTPGSPILAPTTSDAPLPDDIVALEQIERLPRPASALSNTSVEDDDDVDELPIDKTKPVAPTEITWHGGGEKVYVTGTIFQWSRKSKLYPVKGQPGVFSAVIYVRPGTHHLRFIVDGNLMTSNDLPTTVDFGNNLVNYIEVSADDVPKQPPGSTEVMGTSTTAERKLSEAPTSQETAEEESDTRPPPRTKPVNPDVKYSSTVPQYLIDLDKAEDSEAYQYAAAAIEKLPTPPSLPGFLGKPILNAATPMKDDNSVLIMPNHTVLNHLATSSIKSNVLAVSVTTRYKRKYVTTVMYKPTTDDTD